MGGTLNNILDKYKNYELPIDIENIANSLGIKVLREDLGRVDGMLLSDYIGVNKNLSPLKQRFVIAHELCHFLLGEKGFSKGIYHSTDPKEKRADDFATRILLPEEKLKELYMEHENIPTLVSCFGVPEEVIMKRLNNIFCNC